MALEEQDQLLSSRIESEGDPEKTIQCKDMKEFTRRSQEYINISLISSLDILAIFNDNLTYLASQIDPERLVKIQTGVQKGLISSKRINFYTKFEVKKPASRKDLLKYVALGNLAPVEGFEGVYIALPAKGFFGAGCMIALGCSGQCVDGVSVAKSRKGSVELGLNPKSLTALEWGYINTYLVLQESAKQGNIAPIRFDMPPRPLPPTNLPDEKRQHLEQQVITDLTTKRLQHNDSGKFSLRAVPHLQPQAPASYGTPSTLDVSSTGTASTGATFASILEDAGTQEYHIGDEQVSPEVFAMYHKYKQDRMVPTNQSGGKQPKLETPKKYQNLSRAYFKDTILNKDPLYTIQRVN